MSRPSSPPACRANCWTAHAGEFELCISEVLLTELRDLLPSGSYAGIPIVTAREAMERIAG